MTQFNSKIWPSILYFLLYPCFFLYHYLVGKQIIPMFASGWATVGNIIVTIFLATYVLYILTKSKYSPGFHFFHSQVALFFSVIVLYAFLYFNFGAPYQNQYSIFEETIKLFFGLAALYLIGLVFSNTRYSKYMLLFSSLMMTLITFVSTDWSTAFFTLPETKVPSGIVSDYQGFATSFAVTGILALGFMNRPWPTSIFTALCSLTLFIIGSRADMIGFVFVSGVWALVLAVQRSFKHAMILTAAAVVPIAFLLAMPAIMNSIEQQYVSAEVDAPSAITGTFEGNFRQDELLDITNSASFASRIETMKAAIKGVMRTPLIGDYAGQVRDFGSFGMYSHNFVSVWQQFGLLGLLLYMGLSISAFGYSAWHVLVKKSFDNGHLKATLLISSYALFLIVLSKSVFWPVPALAWGLCASHYSTVRSTGKPKVTASAG